MQHAGRAVVFSGSTVGISLLALVVLPVPFLRSLGIAGMLIPLVSVAVAVTLLPVVLATIGPRLDRRHTGRTDRAEPWLVGLGPRRRAPPLGRGRRRRPPCWARSSSPPPRSSSATRAPTRWPSRARRAQASTSSPTRASAPGRSRRSTRWCAPAIPSGVAHALADVDGVQSAVAPADWRRDGTAPGHGHPDPGRQLARRAARRSTASARPPSEAARRRRDRRRGRAERRLPRLGLRQLPARHRADLRADVPAAGAGVPLAGPAAQGRPAEPAVGRAPRGG